MGSDIMGFFKWTMLLPGMRITDGRRGKSVSYRNPMVKETKVFKARSKPYKIRTQKVAGWTRRQRIKI
jgi:hypothetical protein